MALVVDPAAWVVDAFTRANEAPIAAPWSPMTSGGPTQQLLSNALSASAANQNSASAYETELPVVNMGAAITCSGLAGVRGEIGVILRAKNVGVAGQACGIFARFDGFSGTSVDVEFGFFFNGANAGTYDTTNIPTILTVGDRIAAQVIGRTVEVFRWTVASGVWASVATWDAGQYASEFSQCASGTKAGVILQAYTAVANITADNFAVWPTDQPPFVPELTTGAWSKLMREMRLDGLRDGRTGNRGDGTESWRVGAFD